MSPKFLSGMLAIGLLGLVVGVFAPVLGYDFVRYDDDLCVTSQPMIRDGLSAAGVRWAFSSVQCANFYPLTRMSWMLDAELFGLRPWAFHATNLALHALATLAFFAAFLRLSGKAGPSALVAAVFAVHPLHVESVAWVAARKDLLSGLFAALALLAHACVAQGRLRQGWVALGFSAAVLSKATLVVWPLVLLCFDVWPLRRHLRAGIVDQQCIREMFLEKVPLFAIAAVFGVVALVAQADAGALRSLENVPLSLRMTNALASLGAYLADAVWPRDLAVFYPYPHSGPDAFAVVSGAVVFSAVTAFAVAMRHRTCAVAVGWSVFLVLLVPVLGFVQVGEAGRADRYMHLALVGIVFAIVFGVDACVRSRTLRVGMVSLALLWIAGLAVAASAQLTTWKNSESLFRHALRVTERNHVAHINLALVLLESGRVDEASGHLVAALRIVPRSPHANGFLGRVRLAQGRTREAVIALERAVALDSSDPRWSKHLEEARAQSSRNAR